MIYFTSDLHFYHDNVIKFANRPYKSHEDMNKGLIRNWNDIVNATDEVYILGDVTMKGPEFAEEVLYQLKGKKYLIKGNHDHFAKAKTFHTEIFEEICDYKEITALNTRFVLFHYPILEWNGFFRNSIMLHGHQHNHEDYNYNNLKNGIMRYDVGVDANFMKPVSAEQIIEFFKDVSPVNKRKEGEQKSV